MTKIIIGCIVGGIILFLWQFVSWGAVNLHEPTQRYTDKQDAIMAFLNSQNLEEGGYIMPSLPRDASRDQWESMMKETEGKPWASLQYHKELNHNMGMRIARSLIVDMLTVFLFIWLVRKFNALSFTQVFLASLVTGLIVFFNVPYVQFIWYENADIWAHFADAIVSWGIVGLWLGWWLNRGRDRIVAESRVRA